MTFNLTLTESQQIELRQQLTGLATGMTYNQTTGELTIASSDEANEPRIVDTITGILPTINDLPDWSELLRRAARADRAKRASARQEHDAMARIRAKRRRQEALTVSL